MSGVGNPSIVTLTTDFGVSSRYVAAMKGVILSTAARHVEIVDLTHAIPPHDIRSAAVALAEAAPYFPSGTIHVVVVDPRVGTSRPIVYAKIGEQQFVAPDNGVLSRWAARQEPAKIVRINQPRFWRPRVSSTFHGRDILAPIAAHLASGVKPDELGVADVELMHLTWPEVRTVARNIEGEVVEIDSFGNLITNISRDSLAQVPRDESVTIHCDEHETHGIFSTYGDQPSMTLIALIGSGDCLELAIVEENASAMLGVRVGTPVRVSW
jgi:S-adenosylmethionine hydrolase